MSHTDVRCRRQKTDVFFSVPQQRLPINGCVETVKALVGIVQVELHLLAHVEDATVAAGNHNKTRRQTM